MYKKIIIINNKNKIIYKFHLKNINKILIITIIVKFKKIIHLENKIKIKIMIKNNLEKIIIMIKIIIINN